jgi:curli biogenesis system outer membrane secretion channel CsgG/peptidoglycan hydrolase-like protein with peptidoglycan-binding domain
MKPSSARRRIAHSVRGVLAALTVAGLAACASTPTPTPDVKPKSQPTARPVANMTSFSEALVCMDDLFYAYGVRDVRITTKGIPDATGEVKVGARDMLISAVSKMSVKSRAFTFVDYQTVFDPSGADAPLQRAQRLAITPSYYIRGAISQLDDGVVSKSMGGGLKVGGAGVGLNKDSTTSVVSLDMNVGEVEDGTILPGVSSNTSISVRRKSKGGDADARIQKNGAFFQFSYNQAEGMPQAVRTLIELNTIEVLGKLARVPYWRCLGLPQTNPDVRLEAQRFFLSMDDIARIQFVQRALSGAGLYQGKVDGVQGPMLDEAIGRFQADRGLVANRRIDFDLYQALIGSEIKLAGGAPLNDPGRVIARKDVTAPLYISLSDDLELPAYQVGQPLRASARLNANGFLYCYYQDGLKQISRIFPNRFQPNAYVENGVPVRMPDPNAGFRIEFQNARANEFVVCFASAKELAQASQGPDLEPLNIKTLEDLRAAVLALAPGQVVTSSVQFLVR